MEVSCVLSGVLGNRIMSERLADAAGGERHWFDLGVYRKYPAPRWMQNRWSVFESEYVARRWLADLNLKDTVLVNGYTLALSAKHPRMIVATDTTPALLGSRLMHWRFKRIAHQVHAWLPISETVKQSLIENYRVAPERCFVTRSPQPIIDPKPHECRGQILFVGNDFVRKGGPLLIEAMRYLSECSLTVVSNDPQAKGRVIRGITGLAQLADIYRSHDLLVLPTRLDCYPNVICEAAAFGIPSLATRVGSIGELLDESGGNSIPAMVSPKHLAELIRDALWVGYAYRAQKAAEFAKAKLTMERFRETVQAALNLPPLISDRGDRPSPQLHHN